jgi:peptidoglycan hydrolase CwlO-like protein
MLKKISLFALVLVICSTCFGSVFAYDVNNISTDEQKNLDIARISELENSITAYNFGIEKYYNEIKQSQANIALLQSKIKKTEKVLVNCKYEAMMGTGMSGFVDKKLEAKIKALEAKLKDLNLQVSQQKDVIINNHREITKLDEQNYIASQELEFLKTKWGIKDPV